MLHTIWYWPQMIDTMFWTFVIKAAADRQNVLSVNSQNRNPSSNIYGMEIEAIPVKNFHNLFWPVYVLDRRAQSAGGLGPPKWEPRSRIGVYLGHLPFHSGSVALVFNPSTGRVSPHFHVVFDNSFSTVPYMNLGTTPPNWADLVLHSSATDTINASTLPSVPTGMEYEVPADLLQPKTSTFSTHALIWV